MSSSIRHRTPKRVSRNGGIGTYVQAGDERYSDVSDRSNDAVRVTAAQLRCRIVGEGGNLGLTQLARIAFARRGRRLDTDFIHNAGGVSCSDQEVNIKILLDQVVAEGDLTLKQRNRLLREMSEEVARLVLQACYWQAWAIGLDVHRGRDLLIEQMRFMRTLEQQGRLDRVLEHLPDDDTLLERQAEGTGLTRPEIVLLVSYAKHTLYEDLLASDLPEDPCLLQELEHYFPTPLRERFAERIHAHRLRREILCSAVANRLVSTFMFRLQEDLDAEAADAVRDQLLECHRSLCHKVLQEPMIEDACEAGFEAWKQRNLRAVDAWSRLLAVIKSQEETQVAMLSVALQSIRKRVLAATPPPPKRQCRLVQRFQALTGHASGRRLQRGYMWSI